MKFFNNFYHKDEEIGRGSFSIVYKGYSLFNNNVYALKLINLPADLNIRANIYEEIKILKSIAHQNIIDCIDTFESDSLIIIVMEFCTNRDLLYYCKNNKMDEEKTKSIMKQFLNGVQYLQSHHILHRDLKPQNILVNDDEVVKISDFGFAKVSASNDLSLTLCGSPIYMAPEIIKYKKYNNKTDIWSIGIIIFQLIFGITPYPKALNHLQLIYLTDNEPIVFPNTTPISASLTDLLQRILVKDPKIRIDWVDLFNHPWFHKNENLTFSSYILIENYIDKPIQQSQPININYVKNKENFDTHNEVYNILTNDTTQNEIYNWNLYSNIKKFINNTFHQLDVYTISNHMLNPTIP